MGEDFEDFGLERAESVEVLGIELGGSQGLGGHLVKHIRIFAILQVNEGAGPVWPRMALSGRDLFWAKKMGFSEGFGRVLQVLYAGRIGALPGRGGEIWERRSSPEYPGNLHALLSILE
jgi:hypothetical protein